MKMWGQGDTKRMNDNTRGEKVFSIVVKISITPTWRQKQQVNTNYNFIVSLETCTKCIYLSISETKPLSAFAIIASSHTSSNQSWTKPYWNRNRFSYPRNTDAVTELHLFPKTVKTYANRIASTDKESTKMCSFTCQNRSSHKWTLLTTISVPLSRILELIPPSWTQTYQSMRQRKSHLIIILIQHHTPSSY